MSEFDEYEPELEGYLNEDEAVRFSGFAKDTLRDWRRHKGYGPPFRKIGNKVFYIKAGFLEAVLHRGPKPKQPVERKVEKRKREAGRKMQVSGQMKLWTKRRTVETKETITDKVQLHNTIMLIEDRAIHNFYGPADEESQAKLDQALSSLDPEDKG